MGMYNHDLKREGDGIKMSGLLAEAVVTLARAGRISEELVPLVEYEGQMLLDGVVRLDREAGKAVVGYMAGAFEAGRPASTGQEVYCLAIDAQDLALLMDWAFGYGFPDAPDILVWA